MAYQSTTTSGGIQTTKTNTQQLFYQGAIFATGTYVNTTGAPVTITQGTVLGRVNSNGNLQLMQSTNTDGSQIPVGILANTYTVGTGASQTVSYCIAGRVNQGSAATGTPGIIFTLNTDTMTTVILFNSNVPAATTTEAGIVLDILLGKGIIPTYVDENTYNE